MLPSHNGLSDMEIWYSTWQGNEKESTAVMALVGWLYYGRGLASSFSVYVRVFIVLVQTGLDQS